MLFGYKWRLICLYYLYTLYIYIYITQKKILNVNIEIYHTKIQMKTIIGNHNKTYKLNT